MDLSCHGVQFWRCEHLNKSAGRFTTARGLTYNRDTRQPDCRIELAQLTGTALPAPNQAYRLLTNEAFKLA